MSNKRYYFLLGFMTAILTSMFVISCATPLEANHSDPGSSRYNPLYVVCIEE